jgi:glycosyltransferase involved in cell wall biosynthesis
MNYVMVLLVPFYRVDQDTVACESAFAIHLRELLPRISEWSKKIVIHSPAMSERHYQFSKHHLAHINCQEESIEYIDGPSVDLSRLKFFLKSPFFIWPKIWKAVSSASIVHASASKDIFKLFTIVSIFFAVIQGKKTIFAMDIDHRNSAKMSFETGRFSRKSYLLSQYFYNPLISLQLRFASRFCDLVLLKGQALVDDYGKGRSHVKNFYDTAHDQSFVISEDALTKKRSLWDSPKDSVKLVYFGRLVSYKGIIDMMQATQKAAQLMLKNDPEDKHIAKKISLTIIGAGEQEQELRRFVTQHQLEEWIIFKEAMSYGEELFGYLSGYDFLLAAPHSEDTPRSVFDAMACGLPMIAYDTYYYKDLSRTGTVSTVPWLSPDAMAEAIVELSNDPESVSKMINKCRDFAINNTQKIWLDKRLTWTKEFLSK